MKLYKLHRSQTINCPKGELFAFFKSPENLEKITPNDVGFKIITPGPIKIQTGTVIDYTIRILGLGVRWTTMITEFDEPHGFADIALKSPYSYWHHRHIFEASGDSTIMRDEITYALPFGIVGQIVQKLLVKNQLTKIFDYRAKIIDSFFNDQNAYSIK